MPISKIPIFSMLRDPDAVAPGAPAAAGRKRRQCRHAASSQPRDLAPLRARPVAAGSGPGRDGADARRAISPASGAGGAQFQLDRRGRFEVRPAGNAVSLEDEMLKVAANQMDYQAATALYARGLGLIKTALGRRS